eukprot:1143983-Pelagomonas_calceolata.AAC.6
MAHRWPIKCQGMLYWIFVNKGLWFTSLAFQITVISLVIREASCAGVGVLTVTCTACKTLMAGSKTASLRSELHSSDSTDYKALNNEK